MSYKYTIEQDYSDYASGRVFYSLPGHPAFPVRLASEIFQRCVALRQSVYGNSAPASLYDPCCGAAYHLSILAYLHGEAIWTVIGSDVDEKAVELAGRNLALLSVAGLDQRLAQLAKLFELYGKDSHKEALVSGHMLKNRIAVVTQGHPLETRIFRADATDPQALRKNLPPASVDIVFTDVPYGQHSQWQSAEANDVSNPLWSLLEALVGSLSPSSVVAIASDKRQKVSHKNYQRLEQFQIGKRRVIILKPV